MAIESALRCCMLLGMISFTSVRGYSCVVGSRSDCNDHGICRKSSFSPEDPFFNECHCDHCWDGFDCSMSQCFAGLEPYVILPVAIVGVIVLCCFCVACGICLQCCPCLTVAAGGMGVAINNRRRQAQEARQPFFSPEAGAPATAQGLSQRQAFQGHTPTAPPATAPAVGMPPTSRVMQVTCPPGAQPGQLVEFPTPEGRSMQVPVPVGVAPGQMFSVSY
eukprot:TRINITY_DN113037_c0_g1_i1.p1 TRINITY_DN113037_c0_g1~~TRINITY_DN113037_c0_g1_i1.p1  ORF type:complete len:220 (+),score=17.56 TRINITY_DN113037_c0_g1_i1:85-744(+)